MESSSRGDGTSDVVKENPFPRVRWFAFLAVCCPPCSCLLAKLCLLSLLTGTLFVDAVAATVVAVAASRYVIYLNYPFLFFPPRFPLPLSLSLSLHLHVTCYWSSSWLLLLLFAAVFCDQLVLQEVCSVIHSCARQNCEGRCRKSFELVIGVFAKTVKE